MTETNPLANELLDGACDLAADLVPETDPLGNKLLDRVCDLAADLVPETNPLGNELPVGAYELVVTPPTVPFPYGAPVDTGTG